MLLDKPLKVWPLLFNARDKLLIDTAHIQFGRSDVGIRNQLAEPTGRAARVTNDRIWTGWRVRLRELLRLWLTSLQTPFLGLLKKAGDVDGVEMVEESLVDSGHPDGNLVGRWLLTGGKSKFRSNEVPKIGGDLSHQFKHTSLGYEGVKFTWPVARSLRTSSWRV